MANNNTAKITEYSRCKCGAITLYFDNGANNSMKETTRKRLKLSLRGAKKLQDSYCCNHCVNHWGIDLCECGSGEPVGKCDCGSTRAVQTLGEEYDSFSKIVEAFSK